jgi:hypothetical protein
MRGSRRVPVPPTSFAVAHLTAPGACFFVAVLDQLLELVETSLALNDAQSSIFGTDVRVGW